MEQIAVEYLANAFWQLPVLALGAWLLLRACRPGPAAEHRIWVAVLALGVLLPLRGVVPAPTANGAAEPPLMTTTVRADAVDNVRNGSATLLVTNEVPPSTQRAASPTNHTWLKSFTGALSEFVHRVSISTPIAQWIAELWLAVAFWGLLRIALAWRAAGRLVANSRDAALDERQRAMLRECAERVGVAVPEIRESDGIGGPVIVGAIKPVLLWPENFARTSDDEMRAALFHEMAHVQRCDYGINLLCEMAALPLKWHPATHAVERRIRTTREMACDAIAAEAMNSEAVYAECLIRLARSIVGNNEVESSLAAGLLNGNVMEERVMRLMRGKSDVSVRAKVLRGAAGAAAMLAAAAFAAAFHLTPAMAQELPAPPVPVQIVPSTPPASAQVAPAMQIAPPKPPASAPTTAPVVPAVAPAPAKLSPSIAVGPAEPVVLSPSVSLVVKVPAAPVVPAISVVTPVPLPPIVEPQLPVQPRPSVPPQVHPSKPAVPQAHHSKPAVIIDGHLRNLTPAERARVEKQLADAQKKIADATAKINSPEFRKQMEDAQAAALKAQTMFNSAEFQKNMADAQKQIADASAKVNSPEFRREIQAEIDAAAKVNSAEFQKQIGDAQAAALRAQTMLNSAEFQKQMADAQKQIAAATARMNSPEFKKQMEDAARAAAKVNSAEFQKQMADAQKQLADALARMKAEQQKDEAK